MLQAIANIKESLICKTTIEFHWKMYAIANICKKAIIQKLFIDHGRENRIQRHTNTGEWDRNKRKGDHYFNIKSWGKFNTFITGCT
jgi:hypothetical protein